MDAIIKITSSEFDEEVFKKIKSLIKKFGTAQITIAVSNSNDSEFRNETKEAYWRRLKDSVLDIEEGKGITFTMDELEEYIHQMPAK